MTLRLADNKKPGVQTFYLGSESAPGKEYIVQLVRRAGMRRWACSCPDYIFRGATKASHNSCKHIRKAQEDLSQAGGLRRLRLGILNREAA